MLNVIVRIASDARLVIEPGGGFSQQTHVKGIGWVVADGDDWGRAAADALLAAADAVRIAARDAVLLMAADAEAGHQPEADGYCSYGCCEASYCWCDGNRPDLAGK